MKRHKQRLRQNTLVGTSLAPSAAGLLPYPSNMASLKSNMAAAAGDDVIEPHVPGCRSDDALYANGHLTATIDRQVRRQVSVVRRHREAEKRSQFSFVCIF